MSTDRAAKPVAIDRGQINSCVGQRFGSRLTAQRYVFELAWVFRIDWNRGTQHQAIGNTIDAGKPSNAAFAPLYRLPDRLSGTANRCTQANTCDDNSIFGR